MKIDKRQDAWYLNEEKLPGIDLELVKHYRQEGYWPDKTLGDLIEESATEWPERIAAVFGNRRVSYQELSTLSTRLALGFLEIGLRPGDIVTVQLPNILEYVLTLFALGKIGVVFNPIAPIMREKEVTYTLKHCKSKAIVIPYEYHKFNYYSMIQDISGSIPSLDHVIVAGDIAPSDGTVPIRALLEGRPRKDYASDYLAKHKPMPDDICLIVLSSGTTATPKTIMHTHNTEWATVFNCVVADGYTVSSRACRNMALPALATGYGRRSNLLAGIMGGATNIFVDPLTPESILGTLKREKPTHIHGAPALYLSFVDDLLALEKSETESLEVCHYGGAVMPLEVARKLRGLFPSLVTCYGLAEIVPICHTGLFDPAEAQINSAGRPAWGNKVIILNDDGLKLGAGDLGEIAAKGPGLTPGYLNQPEENAKSFTESGFFRTADLGFFDESGYLHITGRSRDVVDRGGLKYVAREVEELAFDHPKIKDVAIVGMPDPRLGQRGCAFAVLREGETLTLDELVSFLRNKGLGIFKLPERLEIVDSLPYTATGKVQKYVLKEQIAKILADEKI